VIRTLICSAAAGERLALYATLVEQEELEVVGEAADAEQCVALASALAPDVVLIDAALPAESAIAATSRLKWLLPGVRIVAFAASPDRSVVDSMIAAGADAYCVKGAGLWELERAIAGACDPLLRLAHALSRAPAVAVGTIVAREVHELTGGAVAGVYLPHDDAGLALAGAAGQLDDEELATVPAAAARAFEDCAPVSAEAGSLAELAVSGASFGDAFALPIVSDGVPLGALLVAMPAEIPLRIDVELVAAIADLAASAVASGRLLHSVRAEARRDALTGLPNRRAFDERLDQLLEGGEPFGIALLDLDDFKGMNDRLGHAGGDQALRDFARVALRTLRASEELYRFGGDEFALLLDSGEAIAHAVGRIRAAIEVHRRPRRLPTISAGAAASPANGRTKAELLARVDRALYVAKRSGKDRTSVPGEAQSRRVLVVDDDAGLRELLRTTLEAIDLVVDEAETAARARAALAPRLPDLIILDVALPDLDGLSFCRVLKADPATAEIPVLILTGADLGTSEAARRARADGFVRKPFSPLELIAATERLLGRLDRELAPRDATKGAGQVQLYAQDLRHLLELERGQRALLQHAYRQTVGALAAALESKDIGTGAHSQRVLRYATELARAVDPALEDPSAEYGFLLHDIGKIGIPDRILRKRGPLTRSERSVLQTHTLLGEQMLAGVPLLNGPGLGVVRSHHERWDGAGYPDHLSGEAIPLGARVFAVADTLDAMTSDRPYRKALDWDSAVAEIRAQAGRQFDPGVVDAFSTNEPTLRRIYYELAAA
jgi:putative two-component system response regulator